METTWMFTKKRKRRREIREFTKTKESKHEKGKDI